MQYIHVMGMFLPIPLPICMEELLGAVIGKADKVNDEKHSGWANIAKVPQPGESSFKLH